MKAQSKKERARDEALVVVLVSNLEKTIITRYRKE